MSPPAGIGAGDVRLAKFDPLPRVLFFDDFDEGINGWCELVGNHDNDLDNIRPLVRDLRPAQLSTCTFFDIGTHGSVDGVYSLKLATRPRVNHMNQLIKRVTYVARGLVRLETWFTYKAETVFDPALTGPKQWDGNYHPVEAMFGDFCFSNDVNDGPDGKRHHCALRYVNTDFEGNFVRKWMYKTSLQVTTKMGSSGFRVGETDRGAPLGEAAVTVQAHAMTCPARDGGGDGRATQKSEVPRIGAAAQRMRDDVVDLDQMR